MNCFGESFKLHTSCDDSFKSYHRPFTISENNNDHLIICESANLVSKYDSSVKPWVILQSWSFEQLNSLVIPPLIDDCCRPNRMIAVHSCNTLIEWAINNDDDKQKPMTQISKKNLTHQIIDILKPSSDILIVFANGWITSLKQLQSKYFSEDDIQPIIDDKKEIIQQIEMLTSKGQTIVYYRTSNDINNTMFIYRLQIINDRIEASSKTELRRKYEAFAFDGQKLVGAIRNDDCIEIYELSSEKKIHHFERSSLITLSSMKIIQSGAYAFLGHKSNGQFMVEVYNQDYHIRIGSMRIDLNDVFVDKFCSLGDTLLIVSNKNILFLPISNSKPLLSQLLTKGLNDDTQSFTNQKRISNQNKLKQRFGTIFDDFGSSKTSTLEQLQQINSNFDKMIDRQELPEEILAQTLAFCTKQHMLLIEQDGDDHKRLDEIEKLFKKLVKIPLNETFMISCLKLYRVSCSQCLLAIGWILDMLPSDNHHLLCWISVLLDVNYQQFIVRPNNQILLTLQHIRQRIIDNIAFFQQLASIEPMIQLIGQQNASPCVQDIGDYCIELLTTY